MYLEDFIGNEDATYDDLALELLDLENDAFKDLLSLIILHSDLEEIESYIEIAEMGIHQYDNTENFRLEAGRL